MINFNPKKWEGSYALPAAKDVRWRAFGLLFFYLLLGIFFLGFDRKPVQIFVLIAAGAAFDVILNGIFKQRKVFPLSAMISCCSLAIILNWSYAFHNLWIPVFICIISKYLITLNGKHYFNPSLFAIVICILFTDDLITLAPSYQWYGSAATASMMIWFIITGALVLFVFKINRNWLIGSFLLVFTLQSIYRAQIMEHIIPWETLWMSSLSSPAFYLFTFYMITDPGTSPKGKWAQIFTGSAIGILDLIYHLKLSYYTFFFAGVTVAAVRYLYFIFLELKAKGVPSMLRSGVSFIPRYAIAFLLFIPFIYAFKAPQFLGENSILDLFSLTKVDESQSGLSYEKSTILEEVDERVAHVAKWVISVGDAAAVADVDLDGFQDVFLTQTLKSTDWRGKLHLNKGDFRFEKVAIEPLEKYLNSPKEYGVLGFALFLDYDNDGDKDLFTGFGFGQSRIFENKMIPSGSLSFEEADIPALNGHTICLSANAFDYNKDGKLDLLLGNTLLRNLPDYDDPTPLNLFDLPQPQYEGDRRMFHFMHESWHNANNGGKNQLFVNTGDEMIFTEIPSSESKLVETRWTLSIGTSDFNDDGFTDIYVSNDFGPDNVYLNSEGKSFEKIEGRFYGDIGLDTYKGMNASVGDLDNNGKEDVYVSNVHHAMQAEGSLLWMNQSEDEKLVMKESATTLNALNTKRFGWGASFVDLNLDGWKDIVQANGMVGDSWDKIYDERMDFWYYQAQIARTGPEIHSYADKWADIRGMCIYENEKDGLMLNHQGNYFKDYGDILEFDHEANTRGLVAADFDNDGDEDLLITNQFGAPFLYKNEVQGKNWVGFEVVGNGENTTKDAVGTQVILHYEEDGVAKQQYQEQKLANGFMAMEDTRIIFGLGPKIKKISKAKLQVKWFNGKEEWIDLPELNTYYSIVQKSNNEQG